MKAIKRYTSLIPFTVIETITVIAVADFGNETMQYSRYFPASLTLDQADKEFLIWARNIEKSFPLKETESITISYGNSVWSY